MHILSQKRIVIVIWFFSVSKPLKDLVNHPSDYLSEICKRLDTPLTGVGYYVEVAKCYNFDIYTIRSFKDCPGGPSNELISAIMAKYPKVTVEMFARVVAKQASREDVAELLRAFDRKWYLWISVMIWSHSQPSFGMSRNASLLLLRETAAKGSNEVFFFDFPKKQEVFFILLYLLA